MNLNTLKRTLLLAFFSIQFSFISAQITYFEGAIIQKNGDTLKGYIDYSRLSGAIKSIKFKPLSGTAVQSYRPNDISGFTIKKDNKIYKSATIRYNSERFDIEDSRIYESIEEAEKDVRWKEDTVFLLTLLKGKINLYEYSDDWGESHFVIQKDMSVYEMLTNLKFKVKDRRDNTLKVTSEENYKPHLKRLVEDCPSVEVNFKQISYVDASIAEILKKYNDCHQNSIYVRPMNTYQKRFYISAGMTQPRVTIIDPFGGEHKFKSALLPTASLGVEVFPTSKKLLLIDAVGLDLSTTMTKLNVTVGYIYLGRTYTYDINYINLSLSPYLKFGHNFNDKVSVFGKLAPSFVYLLKNHQESFSGVTAKRTSFNLLFSAGMRYKRFFIEGKYVPMGVNTINYEAYTLRQGYKGAVIGYYF